MLVSTNVLLNISGDRESVLGSLKGELEEQHNAMTQMEREERRAEVDGQAEDEGVMDEQKLSEKLDTLEAQQARLGQIGMNILGHVRADTSGQVIKQLKAENEQMKKELHETKEKVFLLIDQVDESGKKMANKERDLKEAREELKMTKEKLQMANQRVKEAKAGQSEAIRLQQAAEKQSDAKATRKSSITARPGSGGGGGGGGAAAKEAVETEEVGIGTNSEPPSLDEWPPVFEFHSPSAGGFDAQMNGLESLVDATCEQMRDDHGMMTPTIASFEMLFLQWIDECRSAHNNMIGGGGGGEQPAEPQHRESAPSKLERAKTTGDVRRQSQQAADSDAKQPRESTGGRSIGSGQRGASTIRPPQRRRQSARAQMRVRRRQPARGAFALAS